MCRSAFANTMPELVPLLDRLVALAGEDADGLTRFLTLYQPPAFLTGCSQLSLSKHGTHLIRNYDYAADRFEATVVRTGFLQPVLFVSDCIWGALDGINGSGLAISLAFGGDDRVAPGFGIPVIVRYLLEVSVSVGDALARLETLPSHMRYNLTLADATGEHVTVFLGAGEEPMRMAPRPLATNHQDGLVRRPYHHAVGSHDRAIFLANRAKDPGETAETLIRHFLERPLYQKRFREGFGTLYTAAYHCEARSLRLVWPGRVRSFSTEGFAAARFTVGLDGRRRSGR